MVLKQRNSVHMWEVEGEGVVYDPDSGMGHVLNPTALRIWSLCDGRHSKKEIEADLAGGFPENGETIRNDVSVALKQLTELGLLESCH